MSTIPVTTAPESREDALMRLATQAKASGVKLYQDREHGRFYASSRSQPGALHRLTGFSCTCQGFIRHGRCAHLAALHSALGWIETNPEPTPPAAAMIPCGECEGHGQVSGTVGTGPTSWRYASITCPDCHGAGKCSTPVVADREVA